MAEKAGDLQFLNIFGLATTVLLITSLFASGGHAAARVVNPALIYPPMVEAPGGRYTAAAVRRDSCRRSAFLYK